MDVRGHCDLSPVLVLGGAGFQANRAGGDVDLAHLEVDEFADSPPICPTHLDYRLEPEIGAVCNQLLVLCVFEKSGTNIVLNELRKFWQTEDLGGVANMPMRNIRLSAAISRLIVAFEAFSL